MAKRTHTVSRDRAKNIKQPANRAERRAKERLERRVGK